MTRTPLSDAERTPARAVVLVGAGVESARAYELARERGLFVVGTDRNPRAPGLALADAALVADTRDGAATLEAVRGLAREVPVAGVMTLAHDVPATVATVAAGLGLPGLALESAELAQDKLAMKRRFEADGVPVPPFREAQGVEDLERAAADWGFPLVVKPIDNCGARGVRRVLARDALGPAFEAAHGLSRGGGVMVERFLEGPQLSTESFVLGGTCHTVCWSRRNYDELERFAPYIIEDGGVTPTDLSEAEHEAVCTLLDDAARSLGVVDGPVKGDLVLTPDGPVVIELAARLSGGYLASHQIPSALGVDLVAATMDFALGEPVDPARLVPARRHHIGIRHFFPEPGRVRSIEGVPELEAEPWLEWLRLYVSPGDEVRPLTKHTARAGFVFARGRTAAEAEARAAEGVRRVRIRTEA